MNKYHIYKIDSMFMQIGVAKVSDHAWYFGSNPSWHILIVPNAAVRVAVHLVIILHGGVLPSSPLPREGHGHREEDATRQHEHHEHLDHTHKALTLLLSIEHRRNLLRI